MEIKPYYHNIRHIILNNLIEAKKVFYPVFIISAILGIKLNF